MNEAEWLTRKKRIDTKLRSLNPAWQIIPWRDPQNVLEQAKRYAAGATDGCGNWNGLRVPFPYATNGEIIWHLDTRAEKPASWVQMLGRGTRKCPEINKTKFTAEEIRLGQPQGQLRHCVDRSLRRHPPQTPRAAGNPRRHLSPSHAALQQSRQPQAHHRHD